MASKVSGDTTVKSTLLDGLLNNVSILDKTLNNLTDVFNQVQDGLNNNFTLDFFLWEKDDNVNSCFSQYHEQLQAIRKLTSITDKELLSFNEKWMARLSNNIGFTTSQLRLTNREVGLPKNYNMIWKASVVDCNTSDKKVYGVCLRISGKEASDSEFFTFAEEFVNRGVNHDVYRDPKDLKLETMDSKEYAKLTRSASFRATKVQFEPSESVLKMKGSLWVSPVFRGNV